jgi:nicotinic acid mononucleotide adenylyltransferase
MPRIRRIGLLPGSFNPPHLGHIDLALQARHHAGLEACFFHINSINAAKQADLIPWGQRQQLLGLLLGGERLFILGPDSSADNQCGKQVPQEAIFLPLIKRLVVSLGSPCEVWLVRGSDNFRDREGAEPQYPPGLCDIPHVIGLRSADHRDYDYSLLTRKIIVNTKPISSSEIRRILFEGGTVTHLISRAAEEYIISNHLYGAPGY